MGLEPQLLASLLNNKILKFIIFMVVILVTLKLRILSLWKVSPNLVPKPTNHLTSFFANFFPAFQLPFM